MTQRKFATEGSKLFAAVANFSEHVVNHENTNVAAEVVWLELLKSRNQNIEVVLITLHFQFVLPTYCLSSRNRKDRHISSLSQNKSFALSEQQLQQVTPHLLLNKC